MAKVQKDRPKVRKSVLVFAGVALGLTVLVFVYTTFLSGGGDIQTSDGPAESSSDGSSSSDGVAAPQAPHPPAPAAPGLKPGGRNPFTPVVNTQAAPEPAPAPAPEPVAATAPDVSTEQLVAASQASRYTQLVAEGKCQALPPGEPRTLDQVLAHVNGCLAANPLQPAP